MKPMKTRLRIAHGDLGLSPGVEIPRGDPFADPHDFSLQFYLAQGVSEAIDQGLADQAAFHEWDRTLTIRDRNVQPNPINTIEAGGIIDPGQRAQFASRVVDQLRQSKEVYFLSLDADRAYPKKTVNINEIAQAYEIDWEGPEYTRGRSFKTTTTLYDEWIKYFLAQENQAGTRLIQALRRTKTSGASPPEFSDHFAAYAESLRKVLPHVIFTGVDSKKRTLLFDTTGLELSFDQLSGGEREIAFLVGQIDRFGLRNGVFLLDEPELHLNADLVRTWVAYLTGTVSTGQIWLATHSLEAVEAAGPEATFVLERNPESRKVDTLARLDTRPVLSALSRAVGTPAFSISQLRFVFIEGDAGVGERERFRRLAGGSQQDLRFIECGSCNEVLRRVSSVRALANEAEAGIRIGGVVDRDFRPEVVEGEVFVLPVHEVENFFLAPDTITALLGQNGRTDRVAQDLIREAADRRAGGWIFQTAMATRNATTLPDIPLGTKERAKALTWTEVQADQDAAIAWVLDCPGYDDEKRRLLRTLLETSAGLYRRKRADNDFWKVCEGKQILNDVARTAGFADACAMIQATFVFGSGMSSGFQTSYCNCDRIWLRYDTMDDTPLECRVDDASAKQYDAATGPAAWRGTGDFDGNE